MTCAPQDTESPRRNLTVRLQAWPDGPDRNPGGLWREVRLERTGPARLDQLRTVVLEADEDRAILRCVATVVVTDPGEIELRTLVDISPRSPRPRRDRNDHRRAPSGVWRKHHRVALRDRKPWTSGGHGRSAISRCTTSALSSTPTSGSATCANAAPGCGASSSATGWPESTRAPFLERHQRRSELHIRTTSCLRRRPGSISFASTRTSPTRSSIEPPDRLGILIWQDLPLYGPLSARHP